MKKTFLLSTLLITLNSCVNLYKGTINAELPNKKFQYQRIAVESIERKFFLGIGRNKKMDALIFEAKRNLYTSYQLGIDEDFINFTIDSRIKINPLFQSQKITITADVIKYVSDTVNEKYSQEYKNVVFNNNQLDSIFKVGDSVVYSYDLDPTTYRGVYFDKGKIISIQKNKAKILYKNKFGYLVTKKFKINKLLTEKSNNFLNTGLKYSCINNPKSKYITPIYLGKEKAIFKTENNKFETYDYLVLTKLNNNVLELKSK